MQATDILMGEHRVIEGVLETLEAATHQLEMGQPVRSGIFLDAADFIKGFADGCHHRKEENILFIKMADCGVPVEGGPIGVMLVEHEQGRQYTQGMRQAVEALEAGDESARQLIISNAYGYIQLLRQHIMKEDNILFPMAERAIPLNEHAALVVDFKQVEDAETGVCEPDKYRALADAIHKEVFDS
jgi:hemerythrin-like domain-containing protein